MKGLFLILYVVYSPVLVVLYWRNSIRSLDDVHGPFELQSAE